MHIVGSDLFVRAGNRQRVKVRIGETEKVGIGTKVDQATGQQHEHQADDHGGRRELEKPRQRNPQQIQNGRYPSNTVYGDGKAGERIADILADVNIDIQKRLMY